MYGECNTRQTISTYCTSNLRSTTRYVDMIFENSTTWYAVNMFCKKATTRYGGYDFRKSTPWCDESNFRQSTNRYDESTFRQSTTSYGESNYGKSTTRYSTADFRKFHTTLGVSIIRKKSMGLERNPCPKNRFDLYNFENFLRIQSYPILHLLSKNFLQLKHYH